MIQGCDLSIWIGPIKCNSTTVNSTRSYIQTDLCCWVNHESQVNCPLNTLFQASAGFSSHWKLISPPIGYFGICSNLFFHTIFFVGEKKLPFLKKKCWHSNSLVRPQILGFENTPVPSTNEFRWHHFPAMIYTCGRGIHLKKHIENVVACGRALLKPRIKG